MRSQIPAFLEAARDKSHPTYRSPQGFSCGRFRIPDGPTPLSGACIIVSDGEIDGWEHVSVSFPTRTPTWSEMDKVKDWFWEPTETVMQLHVPKADHINRHEHCLHLW